MSDGRGVMRKAFKPSGVRARSAEALNDIELSGREYDMAEDGREAADTCTLGIGIMERLGGRAAMTLPPGVCERGEVGERARRMSELRSSWSQLLSDGDADIERKCDFAGIGI